MRSTSAAAPVAALPAVARTSEPTAQTVLCRIRQEPAGGVKQAEYDTRRNPTSQLAETTSVPQPPG
eukprot:6827503-Pyramimonas_sp.AAC.1